MSLHGKKGLGKKDRKRWRYDKILVHLKKFGPIWIYAHSFNASLFLTVPNFGTWLLIHILLSLECDFIKLNEVLWLCHWDCNGHVILQAKIMFMEKVKVETIHMRVLSARMLLYIPFNLHQCKGFVHEHNIFSWFHVNVLWQYKEIFCFYLID